MTSTDDEVLRVIAGALPAMGAWIRDALAGGRDAEAELDAMFQTADAVADAAEDAKFGAP